MNIPEPPPCFRTDKKKCLSVAKRVIENSIEFEKLVDQIPEDMLCHFDDLDSLIKTVWREGLREISAEIERLNKEDEQEKKKCTSDDCSCPDCCPELYVGE